MYTPHSGSPDIASYSPELNPLDITSQNEETPWTKQPFSSIISHDVSVFSILRLFLQLFIDNGVTLGIYCLRSIYSISMLYLIKYTIDCMNQPLLFLNISKTKLHLLRSPVWIETSPLVHDFTPHTWTGWVTDHHLDETGVDINRVEWPLHAFFLICFYSSFSRNI